MRGDLGAYVNELDESGDRAFAVERFAGPGAAEVTPFGQGKPGATEAFYRPILVGVARAERATAAAQRATNAFWRVRKLRLQPAVERLVEHAFCLAFRQNAKQRIDARFNGSFTQQVGAKSVNRADVRFLQLLH